MRLELVTTCLLTVLVSLPVGAGTDKAAETLAATRKAIGGGKLDALKTFSLAATLQRNVGQMQLSSDVELLLDLPDKYLRQDNSSGGPINASMTMGFNGDKAIQRSNGPVGGGGIVIRMGGPAGTVTSTGNEKLSAEEQEKANQAMLRSMRSELSRLMLGWFGRVHPALNVDYTFGGEAESPDGKAYVIDAKNTEGFAARLFVDEQTHLPLMLTYQGPQPRIVMSTDRRPNASGGTVVQPGDQRPQLTDEERKKLRDNAEKQIQELQKQPPTMVEYTLYFDDWRDVDGIKFPHRIRRATGGSTVEEWTVTKVKVNPKIDAKKFALES